MLHNDPQIQWSEHENHFWRQWNATWIIEYFMQTKKISFDKKESENRFYTDTDTFTFTIHNPQTLINNKWHNDNCHAVYPWTIKELNECIKNKLFESDFHNLVCMCACACVRINSVVTHGCELNSMCIMFIWLCFFIVRIHTYIVITHKNTLFIVFWIEFARWIIRLFGRSVRVQSGWLSAHFLYFYLSISFWFLFLRCTSYHFSLRFVGVVGCFFPLSFLDRFNNRYSFFFEKKKEKNKCATKA